MIRLIALGVFLVVSCLWLPSESFGQRASGGAVHRPDILRGGPSNELLIHEKSRDVLMSGSAKGVDIEEEEEEMEVEYHPDEGEVERDMLDPGIEDQIMDWTQRSVGLAIVTRRNAASPRTHEMMPRKISKREPGR